MDGVKMRMKLNTAQAPAGVDSDHVKQCLMLYSLPLLRRILIYLNITVSNSLFSEIANNPAVLANLIVCEIKTINEERPLDKISEIIVFIESNLFDVGGVKWLKNDMEACYFYWYALMNISWKKIFSFLRPDNILLYSEVVWQREEIRISDTFQIPKIISGHNERYKSIVRILELLPFTDREIEHLISSLSNEYRNKKIICANDVNITSLMRSKESISFSIRYLQKKKIFLHALEPLTQSDEKYALLTQFFIIIQKDESFKKTINALAKAWSQKKVREKRKNEVKQQSADSFILSAQSIKMLKDLSEKYSMTKPELLEEALRSFYKEMN